MGERARPPCRRHSGWFWSEPCSGISPGTARSAGATSASQSQRLVPPVLPVGFTSLRDSSEELAFRGALFRALPRLPPASPCQG
ncbi:hypothetical protein FNF28_07455 [Cafeteria roenbergensis]|uniref:Uncharacterized protein n=1 Tax=Cafeteria roenbergensis TaxID=33653 RepID=A0A5A8C5T7_CAFRO|nr:hypothetical protein FNF28_07455 [Cafeteria roenbergensis]